MVKTFVQKSHPDCQEAGKESFLRSVAFNLGSRANFVVGL